MDKKIYILGISAFYHDSAACIIENGKILAAAQEERFTRVKHERSFPKEAIRYCLSEANISIKDIELVAFYDQPWLKFDRLIKTYFAYAPDGFLSFSKAIPQWIKKKLWVDRIIKNELSYKGKVLYPEHHESHAASAFFPSPYEKAAVLTIDGVGEWATASWGVGEYNNIKIENELHFPHSLGLLYTAFTTYTGFRANSGEYKVMGLAPYGKPKYKEKILDNLMDLKEDGSFRLNMKYFNYCQGLTMTSEAFHDLLGGPPREPESKLTQREMDLARSVQEVVEEVMLRMARHVRKETGEKYLCLAGGVALNCVANGKILRERIFDDIWIQPAAGDAGGALGAALYAWYQIMDKPRMLNGQKDFQKGSYLGPSFSQKEIEQWLKEERIPYKKEDPEKIPSLAAEQLVDGKVVGWFNGRMEFGPRALGARSILGDSRSPETQSTLNLKIKYRESFRPFAPSCLAEDVSEYFELYRESPYMLLVAPVKKSRRIKQAEDHQKLFGIELLNIPRSDIPAVTHVDYSARIQTVSKDDNPQYYQLIREFKKQTGYGVIVNTSFNVRGEPIVCTFQDAYRCFMRTEMDVLFLENFVMFKREQPEITEDKDWRKEFVLD
ncbi:carbamoyltransferase family protein [Fodinibius saliphilus]|uniref:carbamoyltransferase family protein n=1 Tax=Fodinibius saliphilus TaxID=1920650 RepID=UPI001FE93A60|nr:carbamoyltransferase [Fodinibius saliphilus]